MPQVRPVKKIQSAARYFAKTSQDVHDIAAKFKVTEFAVRKWAKNTRNGQRLLPRSTIQGMVNLRKDRHAMPRATLVSLFEKARKIYRAARQAGEPHHKLASLTAKKIGVPRRRVYDWAAHYGWDG